jgi:hypothetical protein
VTRRDHPTSLAQSLMASSRVAELRDSAAEVARLSDATISPPLPADPERRAALLARLLVVERQRCQRLRGIVRGLLED